MTLYIKKEGVWVTSDRPYVKYNGEWRPAKQVYARNGGSWESAFAVDNTPPSPPVIVTDIDEKERWVNISVRQPESAHQTDIAYIRLLVTYKEFPSTYLDKLGYHSETDINHPNEPWSTFYYNGTQVGTSKDHNSTAVEVTKRFPPAARAGTESTWVQRGNDIFIAAWTVDINGNVSLRNTAKVTVPKKNIETAITRQARILPNNAGTWSKGGIFTKGNLYADTNPNRNGVFYYGDEIAKLIPNTKNITVKSAHIYMSRGTSGQTTSNVTMWWDPQRTKGTALPSERNEDALLGTLAKGQAKWMKLPDAWLGNLKNNTVGSIGLAVRRPGTSQSVTNDYIGLYGWNDSTGVSKSGVLDITWVEGSTG